MKDAFKNKRLGNVELNEISGGFREDNVKLMGISYGMNIVCPSCGEDKKVGFYDGVYVDPKIESAEYRCRCGCAFVCYKGSIHMMDEWLEKCDQHGYSYRHK